LFILPQIQKPAGVAGIPQLPRRASVRVQANADAAKPVLAASAGDEKKFLGIASFTWQKIIPLGIMFFW